MYTHQKTNVVWQVKVGSSSGGKGLMLGADDFLPLFVWVLVQSGMIAAEIEAEYMWGLLHPSLLSGEGGYYLTTLSSAVHVLKNFRACSNSEPSLDVSDPPLHPLNFFSDNDLDGDYYSNDDEISDGYESDTYVDSDVRTTFTLSSSYPAAHDSGYNDTDTNDSVDVDFSPRRRQDTAWL